MFWKDERQCMAGTLRASASTPPGFVPDVASGEAMQDAVVLARARFEQPRHEVCWVGLGFFIRQWRYLSSAACQHLGFRAVHPAADFGQQRADDTACKPAARRPAFCLRWRQYLRWIKHGRLPVAAPCGGRFLVLPRRRQRLD